MLRKLTFAAAAAVALSAGSAHAQFTGAIPNSGLDDTTGTWSVWGGYERSRSPAEVARDNEIERRYRETVNARIPDRKPSNDPWKNVRAAPAASSVDRHRSQW